MSKWDVLVILLYIGIIVGCIFLSKWFFEVVMGSNMPDWVKYMILK